MKRSSLAWALIAVCTSAAAVLRAQDTNETSTAPSDDVAAELTKLGLSDLERGEPPFDASFRLSGFADFAFMGVLVPTDSPWRGSYERYPAFSVGNFNLYLNKNITAALRMFGEVRLTLLPNGSATADTNLATGAYASTLVRDYADGRNQLRWSGISIERVYLEWTLHRLLTLRVGIFLTPYGIWNVDHGSPTIITASRPFIIGQQLFPTRQTGIEALGQLDLSAHNSLGYHFTVSNGVGAVSDYRDFDANKALGGRAYWRYDGFGELLVGGSVFYGTDSSAIEKPSIASDGKHVAYDRQYTAKSDLLSLAADVQWKYKGLHVQSELISQQRRYDERARVGTINPFIGEFLAPMDRLSLGAYALVGYRFDWFGVMPYALWQFLDTGELFTSGRLTLQSFIVGLNVRPIDALVFKVELTEVHFPFGFFATEDPLRIVQAQIACAF